MKVLSLFDGISCARVALERGGIKIDKYYASEIDKYAIQIAQKNYPDTIQLGDVREISLTKYPEINNPDLLIGGSPCQDLSIAKKDRKGLDGEKSSLFWEYVRILKEVKPRFFVLENVSSMPKKDKEIISQTLGVEPVMINAALVSAQNRKRLFWVGSRFGDKYVKVDILQPEDRGGLLKDILEEEVDEKYFLNKERIEYVLNRPKSFAVKINPDKTNTLRTNYGNASANETYVTQRIGQIGKGGQGNGVYSPQGKSTTLTANGGGKGAKTGLYAVALRNRGEGKKPEIGGDKANALTTVQTDSMMMNDYVIRKLTPIECERLQSLDDNYTEGVSNTQRYKMLGNAFNVEVVRHIISFMKF
jgi:DNA (cytosine-5)-methyltransferase 3A